MKRLLIFFLLASRMMAQTHTFPATDTPNAFTGTNTVAQLNGFQVVEGTQYARTSAGIAAAIAALPAGGGTVQLSAGSYTMSSTVTISKPVRVLLDAQTVLTWTGAASATGIFNITTAGSGSQFIGVMGAYSQNLGNVNSTTINLNPSSSPMDAFVIGDSTHETSGLLFQDFLIFGGLNARDAFRVNGGSAEDSWRRVIEFGPGSGIGHTTGGFVNYTLTGASSLENNGLLIEQCQAWWTAFGVQDGTNWNVVSIRNNRFQQMTGSAITISNGGSSVLIENNDIAAVNTTTAGAAIAVSSGLSANILSNHFEANGGAGAGTADVKISGAQENWRVVNNRFWGFSGGAVKALVVTTTAGYGIVEGNNFDSQSTGAFDPSGASSTAVAYRNNEFSGTGTEIIGGATGLETQEQFKGLFNIVAGGLVMGEQVSCPSGFATNVVLCSNSNTNTLQVNYNNGTNFHSLRPTEVGTCTMAAGTCTVTWGAAFNSTPLCNATWNGTGNLTGIVKAVPGTSNCVVTSSVNTDTAVMQVVGTANPN